MLGNEMIFEPQILNSQTQSMDTIDQMQSIHRKSDATIGQLNQFNGVKCSFGLYCENSGVLLSQEMSLQDICYI